MLEGRKGQYLTALCLSAAEVLVSAIVGGGGITTAAVEWSYAFLACMVG